ncbi:MAG: peptidylprolyl isomerase [candidate division Zixibacteria bacterium]|nr:peptidylprolyl isomerase [candidate division Zixibacteria bacterium]
MRNYSKIGLILFVISLMMIGCGGKQQAQEGDRVQMRYVGTLDDGSVFDSSRTEQPFEFTLGAGEAIPGFDQAIVGMAVGETKSITISPEEAYGERREDMFFKKSVADMPVEERPEVGTMVQLRGPQNRVINAEVVEAEGDSVTLDANHPLAGKTLNFEITLLKILES